MAIQQLEQFDQVQGRLGLAVLALYELGKFVAEGRRVAVADVVTRYNEIVEEVETDPSLKIEFRQ